MSKTSRIDIRVAPELKERLQKAADAENRTISNLIEKLLKEGLEQKEQERR